jgi:hypothetical protein
LGLKPIELGAGLVQLRIQAGPHRVGHLPVGIVRDYRVLHQRIERKLIAKAL